MSADPLQTALAHRFDGGQRMLVPVFGSGLHRHLADLTGDPRWESLFGWKTLLAEVAGSLGVPLPAHAQAPMQWDDLVIAATHRAPVAAASKVEGKLLRDHLVPALRTPDGADTVLANIGEGLLAHRDVISLNFDDTLHRALRCARARCVPTSDSPQERTGEVTLWRRGDRTVRIWQLHGSVQRPASIVLGASVYGRAAAKLVDGFKVAKDAERRWLERNARGGQWTPAHRAKWLHARRAPHAMLGRGGLGVMDLFASADLAFLGTSLQVSEVDVWWALHQRARNLARHPPTKRPATIVRQSGALEQLLATGPAGVSVVAHPQWSDCWDALLAPA